MLPKRPKPGEDDLRTFQSEFLSSQEQPAATLIHKHAKRSDQTFSVSQREVVDIHTPGTSEERKVNDAGSTRKQRVTFADRNPEEAMEVQDTHISKVLSEIVERDVTSVPVYLPVGLLNGQGFPVATHRGNIKQERTIPGQKKKSLFALQCQRESRTKFGLPETRIQIPSVPVLKRDVIRHIDMTPVNSQPDGSSSITDQQIHRENSDTLSQMSHEEILMEQKKLLDTMDPSFIAFLKMRKVKSATPQTSDPTYDLTSDPTSDPSADLTSDPSTDPTADLTSDPTSDPSTDSSADLASDQSDKIQMEIKEVLQTHRDVEDDDVVMDTDVVVPSVTYSESDSDKPRPEWVNMDLVETEKLSWMTDLPKPSADSTVGLPARFDFNGHVISASQDLPTHIGLHHHGNEPERAGYSLEELFTLTRSVNTQQRRLGLTTLSKILQNAQSGEFAFTLQSPIIPTLLESGLVILLRWALDDTNQSVFTAAILCLRHLVSSQSECDTLDRFFSWPRGYELASLGVPEAELGGEEEDDNQIQQTDADVIKHDLIKGLLRMDILARLRYILEIARPSNVCVINILYILTRLAQHSLNSAYQIYKCSRLMPVMVKEFLPTMWKPFSEMSAENTIFGQPVAGLLRLLRYMCQTGRNLANILMNEYDLMSVILRYLTPQISELGLPVELAVDVRIESYRLWTVLLLYGYSTASLRLVFPVLMTSLRTPLTSRADDRSYYDETEAVIGLFTAAILCVADGYNMADREDCRDLPGPAFSWNEMDGVLTTAISILHIQIDKFITHNTVKFLSPPLVCATIQFLTAHFQNVTHQPGYDVSMTQRKVAEMSDLVTKMMNSVTYKNSAQKIRDYSNIIRKDLRPISETAASLPSYGALVQLTDSAKREQISLATDDGNQTIGSPVVDESSPFRLLLCLSDFIITLARLDKSLATTLFPHFLDDDIQQYVRRLATSKDHSALSGNYFTRVELSLMMNLLRMVSVVPLKEQDYSRYHQMALSMLPWLPVGSEYMMSELVTLMFRRDFVSDVITSLTLPDLTSLTMDDVTCLRSISGERVEASRQKLLNDVIQHNDVIKQTYLETLVNTSGKQYQQSRTRYLHQTYSTLSLHVGRVSENILPHDWMFLPIVHVYQQHINSFAGQSHDVTPSIVNDVTNCLRYVYLLETFRRDDVMKVSITTRITRLYCCFLAGSDLFLELAIHCCLAGLLREYSRPINVQRINWEEKIPGLVSFYDLFVSLLEQFESVSFGDPLFSCYILLPLQQCYDVKYRKVLWREFPSLLRVLNIPISQLLLPLENFLIPEEKDSDLLELYCRALCSSAIRHQSSPLLYLVAVHHVNRFMYASPRTSLNKVLLHHVCHIKDKEIRHHVLHYKQSASDVNLGFTLYDKLPKNRQTLINDVTNLT